jgi:exopolysaccharide production protein ExoZ
MKKLDSIQVLRAVAAILVIFCHGAGEITANHPTVAPNLWLLINEKGLFGVDIFFVVSGFVMMHIISGRPRGGAAATRFLSERVLRVVPLYWVTTLLSVVVGVVMPALKHKNAYSATYVMRSLLFLPSVNPSTGAPEPVLGLGWTLNYEMFFYVVISVVLFLGIRRVFAAVLAIFVTLVALGAWFNPDDIVLRSWTHTIILEFVLGAMLAELRLSGFRIGTVGQFSLLAMGVISWLTVAPSSSQFVLRGIVWGLPAAAIFAAATLGRTPVGYPKLLTLIGDSSYSLYLTHLFVMRICSLLAYHLPVSPTLRLFVFLAIFPPAAVAVSILSYRKFELSTMRIGRQLIQSRSGMGGLPERIS